jgi:hypothetical protein
MPPGNGTTGEGRIGERRSGASAAECAARRRLSDEAEAFPLCGFGKTVVQANEREPHRVALCGNQRRGELQTIGGAKRMDAQESLRRVPDCIRRQNFIPGVG